MSFDLRGKTAFVTGATSGIGREFAMALAAAGAAVAVVGRREDRLASLVRDIEAQGGRALAIPLDVNDLKSLGPAIALAEEKLGPLWLLVNNSGVAVTKSALDHTEDDYDQVLNTNLKAPFFLAQAAAKAMIRQGGGRIVNIASIGAMKVLGGTSTYCISKAGIAHMTRCMALEWAQHNINVNAICPGYVRTEMTEDFFNTAAGGRLMAKFPRKSIGEPDDLNGLLLLLASDQGSFITGSLMVADGGQILA